MEQVVVEQPTIRTKYYDHYVPVPRPYYWPWYEPYDPWHPRRGPYWEVAYNSTQTNTSGSSQSTLSANFCATGSSSTEAQASMSDDFDTSMKLVDDVNDSGITVPGSESQQRFTPGLYFPTESHSDVIVIKLRGMIGNKKVAAPVTVEHKPQCGTCGRANKAGSAYCSKCGTALLII